MNTDWKVFVPDMKKGGDDFGGLTGIDEE